MSFNKREEANKFLQVRYYGPVWQGSGSTKNSSGSGFSGGAASLVELEPFCKAFGKMASC